MTFPISNKMQIILLKDVPKVGRKYDVKNVADGFATNMLLPRGLAQIATIETVKKIEQLKANDLTQKKVEEELLLKSLDQLKNTTITIRGKANEKGHLFAGITKEMLVKEIEKTSRIKISPEFINLEKPLKEIGEHKIVVNVGNKKGEFTLVVESE